MKYIGFVFVLCFLVTFQSIGLLAGNSPSAPSAPSAPSLPLEKIGVPSTMVSAVLQGDVGRLSVALELGVDPREIEVSFLEVPGIWRLSEIAMAMGWTDIVSILMKNSPLGKGEFERVKEISELFDEASVRESFADLVELASDAPLVKRLETVTVRPPKDFLSVDCIKQLTEVHKRLTKYGDE